MTKILRTPEDTAVDVEIGSRIRKARMRAGMSQEKLSEALGVTFQQIQKYEKGVNRVSGSRLIAMVAALNVPASDLLGETEIAIRETDPTDQETARIVRICGRLDREQRVQLLKIAQTFRPADAARIVEAAE